MQIHSKIKIETPKVVSKGQEAQANGAKAVRK